MTAVDNLLAAVRPEPKRDRYGRYLITPRAGGKPKPYTRATTWAKTMADQYGLQQWQLRMCALGLGARHDLYARVAATRTDDKDGLNKLVEQAIEAAKASAGANLGTALHEFTERVDLGEEVSPPPPWDADVAAYRTTLAEAGVTVLPDWVERVVVCDGLEVAGTLDRLVEHAGRVRVADLKTGNVEYAWGEIAIQLAIYAHATSAYNYATDTHLELPSIDTDVALVIHLPAGKATCTIFEVDIAAGWEAALLAERVRGWRKRKDLAKCVQPAPGTVELHYNPIPDEYHLPAFSDTEKVGLGDDSVRLLLTLRRRAEAVKANPDAAKLLAATWPAGVPSLKSDDLTPEHLAAIDAAMSAVQEQYGIVTFPMPEDVPEVPTEVVTPEPEASAPNKMPDEGPDVDGEAIEALVTRLTAAGSEAMQWFNVMAAEAHNAGLSISLKQRRSMRRFEIARALLAAWHAYPDGMVASFDMEAEILRTILVHVLDTDQPMFLTTTLGAAFALCDAEQARRVADLLGCLGTTLHIGYAEDGRVVLGGSAITD